MTDKLTHQERLRGMLRPDGESKRPQTDADGDGGEASWYSSGKPRFPL